MRRATGTGAGPDRTSHPASLAVLRADHRSRGLPPAVRPVLVALLAGLHQPGLADPRGAAARGYRTPRPSHVPPRMLEELSPTAGSTTTATRWTSGGLGANRRRPARPHPDRPRPAAAGALPLRLAELTAVAQQDLQDGRAQQTGLIVYALAEMQREGRPRCPQGLLKLLRSTGDPTRLQVLQLLVQQPRSTGQIAGLIGSPRRRSPSI